MSKAASDARLDRKWTLDIIFEHSVIVVRFQHQDIGMRDVLTDFLWNIPQICHPTQALSSVTTAKDVPNGISGVMGNGKCLDLKLAIR